MIEVTQQRADWYTPWQRTRPQGSSGSGFLIGPGRIMTNAHVVSDARQIVVRRNRDNQPYFAELEFIAHDSDLATLRVRDADFARGVRPLRLGQLPSLRSRVRTYGFPAGGEKISRTEGVVSRIQFITYLHSGADSHLGVQTDSAINPGNSGGPVVQEGQVIGVAFQTDTRLNDVGYFIPAPVLRRFLEDIADGRYDGYGDTGIVTTNLINPSYRSYLGLPPGMSGVVVERVLPGASADGFILPEDAILGIEGVPVLADGTADYHGYLLSFEQVVEEKQIGEPVRLTVWRAGQRREIAFPLRKFEAAERMRSRFDQSPPYLVYAGLVFMDLDREFLQTFGNFWENAEKHLLHAQFFEHLEGKEGYRRHVVLARVLPHRVNSAYRSMVNSLVSTVNGRPIGSLGDLSDALAAGAGGFHLLTLDPGELLLVLARREADLAHAEILASYGIDRERRLR
jgi:S1-C subfamily serine protease